MTPQELAIKAKHAKPHVRYAYGQAHGGGAVAAYDAKQSRWIPVAGQLIGSGEWYSLDVEVVVNGKPLDTTQWNEI